MDDYGNGFGIQESSNLQTTQQVSANPIGDTVFDSSQYAFFGNEVVEEVELGGLEDDEVDLEPDGFHGENFPLEREEGDASASMSSFDDLAIMFSRLNKTVGGSAGFIGDLGSRESSSASEWAQEANVSNWVGRHAFDGEIAHDSKKWSSQPYSASARLMESTSLHRTSSHTEQHHRHLYQQQIPHIPYSSDPILIPKAPPTSYLPLGDRLRPHSPNDQSSHPIIFHQSGGLQVPISSSSISPFSNSQLEMDAMTHGSQFGGNLPQMPHGLPVNGRPQNHWMNQNSQHSDDRSGLFNNVIPHPPKMMLHQHSQRNRMHNPFQPSMSPVSGLRPQLLNPSLSQHIPMMNNFEMLGSQDLRDQRALSMMISRHSYHGSELGLHRGDIGWPRFKSKHMSTDEIDNVLRSQLSSIHSNNPYVDDYYHQACLSRKVADAKLKHHFCPMNLSDGPARARTSAEPHAFLQVDALGRVSFSSVRRPRPLLEVDSSDLSSTMGSESKLTEKPLEQEPMLGARVAIEDGINLLMDVDDIDRFLQFNAPAQLDGGARLRQKRKDLLEDLASSLQLVDPLGKNGSSVDLASKDDLVFLRLVSLRKGRKFLVRYLQLLPPGELARVVCMAIFRHLSFLFCNLPADLATCATTVNLVKSVSSCVLGMDLKGLGACLASLVCSAEHPPFGPTGDGATVVLKSTLDKATELLTDPRGANSCSMSTRSFWQASFDAFFDLLTKYCLNKYKTVVQSTGINAAPDVARAVSREMPVELLRASLPHTNEQQRKVLLELAQRSMPVSGSSNHGP